MLIICDNYIDGIFKTANFKFLNLNYIICYSHPRVTFPPLHPKSRKISGGNIPCTKYLVNTSGVYLLSSYAMNTVDVRKSIKAISI